MQFYKIFNCTYLHYFAHQYNIIVTLSHLCKFVLLKYAQKSNED